VFLAAIVIGTRWAWQLRRETRPGRGQGEESARRHFLAGLAAASGALSALVVAAMWLPVWVLGPCLN
jgi:fatty acid desaturase